MTSDNQTRPNRKTNNLDDFWMPFTANRQFKAKPRLLDSAEGMYFTRDDGHQVLDGTAGLWCCNAGHGRREITEAVSRQIALAYQARAPVRPPLALSPALIVEKAQIDSLVEKLADSIRQAS
ncbi:MAG TPA: hypothetical protein VGA52_15095 [Anaerolineales bacterium]